MTELPTLSPNPLYSMLDFVMDGVVHGPLTFSHVAQAIELMGMIEYCPAWLECVGNVVLIHGPVDLDAVREMAKASLLTTELEIMQAAQPAPFDPVEL